MSKDTIYRQDAIDAIYEHEFPNWCDKDEVSDILMDLPSAQKSGKWTILRGHPYDMYLCSCCGKKSNDGGHYCSYCGAIMDSEKNV